MRTIAACRRAARLLRRCAADTLMLLLPEAVDWPTLFMATEGTARRAADRYDAPELVRRDPLDLAMIDALRSAAGATPWTVRTTAESPDSVLAALYFLAGEPGTPLVLAALPGDLAGAGAGGAVIAAAAARARRRLALVAVGELASGPSLGARSGRAEHAVAFDHLIIDHLLRRDLVAMQELSEAMRRATGESLAPQLVALLAAAPATL